MSAIFGALSLSGAPLQPGLAESMAKTFAARPADAEGYLDRGVVLLGARTRWFTAQARGQRPPWVDGQDGLVCVGDVRLDERDELAAGLGLEHASELPDEALVVAAYRRWGEDFARHLLGDFALALWDPGLRRMLLARDAYGVRPLYYARLADCLLFASQARALFAHTGLVRAADPLRMAQYLAREFADTERTFFQGVRRLSPGHTLAETPSGLRIRPYFAFDSGRQLPRASSADYAHEFRRLFLVAVQARTRSDGLLGCMLSGGLDSSGLLGALRVLEPERPLLCLSARFPDFPEVDERAWLDLQPQGSDLLREEVRVDRLDPLDSVDALHAALDEPFHAPNLFVYDALARRGCDVGARVILDGLDGDTVVDHGFLFLRELLYGGRLRQWVRNVRALKRRTGLPYKTLLDDCVLAPERARMGRVLRAGGMLEDGYLSRDFRAQSGLGEARRACWEQALASQSSLRASHHHALTDPIMAFYLEVHDKAAAALGVEHRHPYFDLRLMQFCLALPPEQRLHDGWDRVIQRRAFADLAPEPIRARQTKSVWTPVFERQLLGRHNARVRGLLEAGDSPLVRYCDLPRLRRDLVTLRPGSDSPKVLALWCAITLGLWLQRERV